MHILVTHSGLACFVKLGPVSLTIAMNVTKLYVK